MSGRGRTVASGRPPLVAGLACLAAACGVACGGGAGTPSSPPAASQPAPTPVTKLMPLGDSITQANHETNSYRRPLWKRLPAGRFDFVGSQTQNHQGPPPNPDFDVDHEGHWGWQADEILAEIDGWARAHQPDIVLLHLGTNDALRGQDEASTLAELGAIVERLRAANPRVTVLLAQLIPTLRDRAAIERLNAGIPALAARLDSSTSAVVVVDQSSGFDPVADTRDGIHPNASGEEKMAAVWHAALERVLSRAQPPRAGAAIPLPATALIEPPVAQRSSSRRSVAPEARPPR